MSEKETISPVALGLISDPPTIVLTYDLLKPGPGIGAGTGVKKKRRKRKMPLRDFTDKSNVKRYAFNLRQRHNQYLAGVIEVTLEKMLRIIQEIQKGNSVEASLKIVDNEYSIDPEEDLNLLSPAQLAQRKAVMDEMFHKNLVRPGDPGFVYDKEVSFENVVAVKEDNDWDENEEGENEKEDKGKEKKGQDAEIIEGMPNVKKNEVKKPEKTIEKVIKRKEDEQNEERRKSESKDEKLEGQPVLGQVEDRGNHGLKVASSLGKEDASEKDASIYSLISEKEKQSKSKAEMESKQQVDTDNELVSFDLELDIESEEELEEDIMDFLLPENERNKEEEKSEVFKISEKSQQSESASRKKIIIPEAFEFDPQDKDDDSNAGIKKEETANLENLENASLEKEIPEEESQNKIANKIVPILSPLEVKDENGKNKMFEEVDNDRISIDFKLYSEADEEEESEKGSTDFFRIGIGKDKIEINFCETRKSESGSQKNISLPEVFNFDRQDKLDTAVEKQESAKSMSLAKEVSPKKEVSEEEQRSKKDYFKSVPRKGREESERKYMLEEVDNDTISVGLELDSESEEECEKQSLNFFCIGKDDKSEPDLCEKFKKSASGSSKKIALPDTFQFEPQDKDDTDVDKEVSFKSKVTEKDMSLQKEMSEEDQQNKIANPVPGGLDKSKVEGDKYKILEEVYNDITAVDLELDSESEKQEEFEKESMDFICIGRQDKSEAEFCEKSQRSDSAPQKKIILPEVFEFEPQEKDDDDDDDEWEESVKSKSREKMLPDKELPKEENQSKIDSFVSVAVLPEPRVENENRMLSKWDNDIISVDVELSETDSDEEEEASEKESTNLICFGKDGKSERNKFRSENQSEEKILPETAFQSEPEPQDKNTEKEAIIEPKKPEDKVVSLKEEEKLPENEIAPSEPQPGPMSALPGEAKLQKDEPIRKPENQQKSDKKLSSDEDEDSSDLDQILDSIEGGQADEDDDEAFWT